ncbi:MAG: YihY/virulence factor BrkB family protein [Actinomycetota bacterium]|nr:YihY/virulence factor BrkB family protein [Actinomycetota bacterium]
MAVRTAEDAATEAPGGLEGVVGRLDRLQRDHAWLAFPFAVVKKFGEDQAGNLAALIAYFAFFSLFPLLLALVTVLGFVLRGNAELQRRVVDSALVHFPVIGDQIRDNIGSLHGSGLALAVGLGLAIWAGMRMVQAARDALNSIWDVPMRTRAGFFPARLRSLAVLGLVGGTLLITAAVSSVAAGRGGLGPAVSFIAPVLSMAVNIGLFLVAFQVLTDRHLDWPDIVPGAVLAGVAATVFQVAGGVYVKHTLRDASQTYGTFAVVIGLLSWIHLQAQVTLIAAELNVVRARRLWPRSLTNSDLTEPDRAALAQHAEVEERLPSEDVRVAVPGENHERGVNRPEVEMAPLPPHQRRP